MPTTTPAVSAPALDALRRPIRDYAPEDAAGQAFRAGMLGLTDLLEELREDYGGWNPGSEVVETALHAFPRLIAPGPTPAKLLGHALRGRLIDAEATDMLHTLGTVRGVLKGLEPTGFAAALLRAVLLAIYRLIELFVVQGNEDGLDQCLDLLATAEAMAHSLAEPA